MTTPFAQTPKYSTESSDFSTMARFYIADSLIDAIKVMYKGKVGSTTVLGSLLTKLQEQVNSGGYFEFLLSGISTESRQKYFLSETVGTDFALFGMGKAPEVLSCSGVLKNTKEDEWQVQFLEFFNNIGGINALAKLYQYAGNTGSRNKNYVTFQYNNRKVNGALLSVSHSISALAEMDIPFSFTFVVTKEVAPPVSVKASATSTILYGDTPTSSTDSGTQSTGFSRETSASTAHSYRGDGTVIPGLNVATSNADRDEALL